MIWPLKKCNKNMGSPCLFTHQQAFKMRYFYWLWVKNSNNYLQAEFSLCYLGDAKFYLESKASFIDMSSIASFKLFLNTWLREYWFFWTVPRSAWSPCLGQSTPSWELLYFQKKNCVPLSNFFVFFQYVLY